MVRRKRNLVGLLLWLLGNLAVAQTSPPHLSEQNGPGISPPDRTNDAHASLLPAAPPLLIEPKSDSAANLSPAAIGWGNLIVPGLGATLRGKTGEGLLEAVTEIGLFYGGTFGVREGGFTIDSTVKIPEHGSLYRPLLGQTMQEIGLKLHMYDTFYHYQQVCRQQANSAREQSNPQPLYQGSWSDTLLAPFRWKNFREPWVWGVVLATTAYEFYDYRTTTVARNYYQPTTAENTLEGANSIAVIPLGSSFGEEVLFRGFIERELRGYTGSLILADALQATAFMLLHPPENRAIAFTGGLYFGFLADRFHGDLEPSIAAHFWVDAISGFFSYLQFRRAQGKNTPFAPPLGMRVSMPF